MIFAGLNKNKTKMKRKGNIINSKNHVHSLAFFNTVFTFIGLQEVVVTI